MCCGYERCFKAHIYRLFQYFRATKFCSSSQEDSLAWICYGLTHVHTRSSQRTKLYAELSGKIFKQRSESHRGSPGWRAVLRGGLQITLANEGARGLHQSLIEQQRDLKHQFGDFLRYTNNGRHLEHSVSMRCTSKEQGGWFQFRVLRRWKRGQLHDATCRQQVSMMTRDLFLDSFFPPKRISDCFSWRYRFLKMLVDPCKSSVYRSMPHFLSSKHTSLWHCHSS